VREGCRKLFKWPGDVISFDGPMLTWLIILGVTLPDVHTLSASVGVLDESGIGLTIHRPSPDDRETNETRFSHQVKGAFSLTDP